MVELPHTLVGIAIAAKLQNPALSLPLAFTSHFILDLLPHWNPHLNKEMKKYGKVTRATSLLISADVTLSLTIGSIIAFFTASSLFHFFIILLGGFLAVLPDIVEGPYFFWGWRYKPLIRWVNIQSLLQTNIPPLPGILTQILVIIASIWWILS